MERNDGGPAFPELTLAESSEGRLATLTRKGMSLRDYFAAKALPAEITHWLSCGERPDYKEIAESCYEAADAMLEARKK